MSATWYLRFLTSTRGQIILLLRRDTRTVEEMASELHLTDNAVRAHLAALERDGLVRQQGVRRDGGVGKPAHAYELTADAEQLFPKSYAIVLRELLDSLAGRLSPDELTHMLRGIGSQIARGYPLGKGTTSARLASAAAAINQLGGLAETEERDGEPVIRGYDCPLASLVPNHPEVCQLAEAFVSEVAGVPLHECCDRTAKPRCRFELLPQS